MYRTAHQVFLAMKFWGKSGASYLRNLFKKWANPGLFFVYFCIFSKNKIEIPNNKTMAVVVVKGSACSPYTLTI